MELRVSVCSVGCKQVHFTVIGSGFEFKFSRLYTTNERYCLMTGFSHKEKPKKLQYCSNFFVSTLRGCSIFFSPYDIPNS